MIIDHTHPLYVKKRNTMSKDGKYNGAYYYSREIVKNIIPNVKTDRNWITIRLPEMTVHPDHSIIFIHNNRNPNYYNYLRNYKDCILVCSLWTTVANMQLIVEPTKVIYLPLSVDVKQVEKYRVKEKTKEVAYAGRRQKLGYFNNRVPSGVDILSGMPQSSLLREMAKYKKVYASGRTAIQAKILGCEVLAQESNFPDSSVWKVLDNREAAKKLQKMIGEIDHVNF